MLTTSQLLVNMVNGRVTALRNPNPKDQQIRFLIRKFLRSSRHSTTTYYNFKTNEGPLRNKGQTMKSYRMDIKIEFRASKLA